VSRPLAARTRVRPVESAAATREPTQRALRALAARFRLPQAVFLHTLAAFRADAFELADRAALGRQLSCLRRGDAPMLRESVLVTFAFAKGAGVAADARELSFAQFAAAAFYLCALSAAALSAFARRACVYACGGYAKATPSRICAALALECGREWLSGVEQSLRRVPLRKGDFAMLWARHAELRAAFTSLQRRAWQLAGGEEFWRARLAAADGAAATTAATSSDAPRDAVTEVAPPPAAEAEAESAESPSPPRRASSYRIPSEGGARGGEDLDVLQDVE
jgi:hypothetical protein